MQKFDRTELRSDKAIPGEGNTIGLIAGGGRFPLLTADAVRRRGIRIVAIAHEGETDPALTGGVDLITWIKLGQLGKLISTLKREGVREAIMAGTITKRRMFSRMRPDLKGVALMSKMAMFHDDGILRALASEFLKEGIEIISSTRYLPELLAQPGCMTRKKPGKVEKEDIDLGWKVAKGLGGLDVGQCAVVRGKTVLALEAIDGTDETILRGGRLAGEKAVVVKVSKPNQDLRFDVPAVGPETVRVMSRVKASVLAIEAGKTLIFEKTEMIELANRSGISIVARGTIEE